MTNKTEYKYWAAALSGEKPPMHEGDPQSGFYRLKKAVGIDSAVAYWHKDGSIICTVDEKVASPAAAEELWTRVGACPVKHSDYLWRVKNGRWPNDAEHIGSNNPPPDDTVEGIQAEIDALEAQALAYVKAGAAPNQNVADKASDIANSFGEIEKKVIGLHKIAKQPHLDACRVCDGSWFPLRDRAAKIKSTIKATVITPFLLAEKKKQEELVAKAEKLGIDTAPLKEDVGAGSNKRTVSLRKKISAKITDYDTVLMAVKNNSDVRELVQRLADAAARGGNPLPGSVTVEIETAA